MEIGLSFHLWFHLWWFFCDEKSPNNVNLANKGDWRSSHTIIQWWCFRFDVIIIEKLDNNVVDNDSFCQSKRINHFRTNKTMIIAMVLLAQSPLSHPGLYCMICFGEHLPNDDIFSGATLHIAEKTRLVRPATSYNYQLSIVIH